MRSLILNMWVGRGGGEACTAERLHATCVDRIFSLLLLRSMSRFGSTQHSGVAHEYIFTRFGF